MSTRRSDAWIFVSHSIKDLGAVRKIRNAIEERGANPILFFLKQQIPDEQLKAFLRSEIAARSFFVLCDSENARTSEFVKFEIECVNAQKHIAQTTIDLAINWEDQLTLIEKLLPAATIFVSYAHADRGVVQPYIDYLIKQDVALFDPASETLLGEAWQHSIQRAVADAACGGTLIQFVSQRSLQSKWVAAEFNFFVSAADSEKDGRKPILIALEPLQSLRLPPAMQAYSIIDATSRPFGDTCEQVRHILRP